MKKETFLYVSAFLMDGSFAVVGICVPLLAIGIGATYDDLGIIGACGAFAYSIACLVSGNLSDRLGYRRVMTIASFFVGVAFISYGGVGQIWHFIFLSVCTALAIAHYWPPLQAWLGQNKPRSDLLHSLGRFNIAWALGVCVGPIIGGQMFEADPYRGFIVGSSVVFLIFLGLLIAPVLETQAETKNKEVDLSVRAQSTHFLPLALLANFATFFSIGVVRSLFPKLATDLGIAPGLLGYLLALIALAQLATFYLMARADWWQFKVWPILCAQIFAALGLGLLSVGTHPVIFACGFLLIGGLIGVTFTASIFYSLYAGGPGGRRAGVHEAIVGSGFLLGPLAGGFVAEHVDARMPYMMACSVILLTMVVQLGVHHRKNTRDVEVLAND